MNIRWIAGAGLVVGLIAVPFSLAATRYVDVDSPAPDAPYTNWTTASRSLQPAINAAASGDEILVAPGTYLLTGSANLIPIEKTLAVRSTQSRAAIIDAQNLSQALVIQGADSVVEGFTVRHGTSGGFGGGLSVERACTVRDCLVTSNRAWGGGGVVVLGEATNARIERCAIVGNQAEAIGGGVLLYHHSQGVLDQCVISDNVSSNEGGGVYIQQGGTVSNCWISGNRAMATDGGGLYLTPDGTTNAGRVVNSVVVDNLAANHGGGAYCSGPTSAPAAFVNCTIVSNAAAVAAGGLSVYATRVVNSILYFNSAPVDDNLLVRVPATVAVSNCCTPADHGWPNITNAPAFVDAAAGDFRLATASFCIDAGTTNGAPPDDFDGHPRPRVGMPKTDVPDPLPPRVDIGAFEYGFHFNDVRFAGSNVVQLLWDVQDRGIYKLDASTNPAANPPDWIEDIEVLTNSPMAAGAFAVHTQQVAIPFPVPAQAVFRLRVSHTVF